MGLTKFKAVEEEAAKEKARTDKLFIPQEGETYKVFIYDEEPKKVTEETKKGSFEFHHVKVKIGDNDKTWKVFLSDVAEIIKAAKKHPDNVIDVERPRGSKKVLMS